MLEIYDFLLIFSLVGTGDDLINITVEKCATEECIMMPVSVSAVNQFSIILEPPTDHDYRIELVNVKKNISVKHNDGTSLCVDMHVNFLSL